MVHQYAIHLHKREACRRCRFNPWSGRFPGGVNGDPFQYSCLKNPMDRGVWQATIHRVAKSWMQLSVHLCTHTHTHTHTHTLNPETVKVR